MTDSRRGVRAPAFRGGLRLEPPSDLLAPAAVLVESVLVEHPRFPALSPGFAAVVAATSARLSVGAFGDVPETDSGGVRLGLHRSFSFGARGEAVTAVLARFHAPRLAPGSALTGASTGAHITPTAGRTQHRQRESRCFQRLSDGRGAEIRTRDLQSPRLAR